MKSEVIPIIEHKTWDILDSSKVKAYMTCPRAFFYEYICGWRREGGGYHLHFGAAFHEALEFLYKNRYMNFMGDKQKTELMVAGAYDAFMKAWDQKEMPFIDEKKNPENALIAIIHYIDHHQLADQEIEILHTESAGSVPISATTFLQFRLDLLYRKNGKIYVKEHKTTGSFSSFGWRDQWYLSFQVMTYLHVLYGIAQDDDKVGGIDINGIAFTNKAASFLQRKGAPDRRVVDFENIPIKRPMDQMRQWLFQANSWTNLIKEEVSALREEMYTEYDSIMKGFIMNTESCNKYGGCPFKDMCQMWANPLQHCAEVPLGYEIERWDPSDYEDRHVILLGAKNE